MLNFFKRLSIGLVCASVSILCVSAKTITGMSQGTLRGYFSSTELTSETYLEISGTINGDDLGLIRNMVKNYSLYTVNLRNAVIVKGGTVGDTYESEVAGSYGDYDETKNIIVNEDNAIPEGMFYGCDKLQYVHLPESVTKIGYRAFYGCSNLKSLGFGDTEKSKITTIGEESFAYCSSLQYLEIPKYCEEIGLAAFKYCTNLSTVKLGVGRLLRILDEAFMGCSKLTAVSIPDNLQQLGGIASTWGHVNHDQGVFAYCRALESVNFTNTFNTLSVKGKAFNGCTALKTVSNTYLEDWFDIKFEYAQGNPTYYSHSLTFVTGTLSSSIVIPEGVRSLSTYAFVNCDNITSVEFPATMKSIGSYAFMGCSNLEEIRIKDLAGWASINFGSSYEYVPVTDSYGNIAYSSDEDGPYQLNRQVIAAESPMKYAKRFYVNGELLEDLVIPDGVTSVGRGVFAYISHLRSVKFPASVTAVGELAFDNCNNIETVWASSKRVWDNIDFKGMYNSQAIINLGEKYDGYYYDYEYQSATIMSSNPTIYGANLLFNSEELIDGENYSNDSNKQLDALTFTKTFSASNVGAWNAFYVPMSINVEEYANDLKFAKIYAFCATVDTNGDGRVDANDENYLFVLPVTEGCTKPNVPYLISPKEAKTYVINSADNLLYAKADGMVDFSTTSDKYTITGLNEPYTVVAGDNNFYVSASGNLNYRTTGSVTVKPNRWVMHRESKEYGQTEPVVNLVGERGYRIVAIGDDISFYDAATIIKDAQMGGMSSDVFSIDGRKMDASKSLPAGIYIKNGKKYIVR